MLLGAGSQAFAQLAPTLFYSDIQGGPATGGSNGKGAIVSVYGNNLGSARGESTVTVGGVPAENYLLWTNTRVAFQIGAGARSGDILVHGAGSMVSNPLPFAVRKGNIHFVSAGKVSGNGSYTKPWNSLSKAAYVMAPGDITYVLKGVQQSGADDYNASLAIASSGRAGLPKALVAYPGADPSIGASNGQEYGLRTPAIEAGPFSHWVIAGFTLRGKNEALGLVGGTDWRIVGNDISCPNGGGNAGCVEVASTTQVAFLGNTVHDTSPAETSKTYHSVYFTTDSNHVEVGWNRITNNRSCRGIQFHSSPEGKNSGFNQYDLSVHDNIISGQICDGINFATIDPSKGRVEAFNNLIYHVGIGPDPPDGESSYTCIASPGITNRGSPGTGTARFYNNTLSDCGARGGSDAGAFSIGSGSPTIQLENNLIQLKDHQDYFTSNTQPSLMKGTNNAWYGAGSLPRRYAAVLQNNIFTGPALAPGLSSFQLPNGSPAIGAGASTGLSYDIAGTSRTASGKCDIGAYQHIAQP